MINTGTSVKCLTSKSRWYDQGSTYVVFKDAKGDSYTCGGDGMYDQLGKTMSTFSKPYKEPKHD